MKQAIARKVYKWLQDDILKVQAELKKTDWKEKCDFAFTDGQYDYYKFKSSDMIPLHRLERIQVQVIMLDNRLSKSEFDTLVEICMQSLNKTLTSMKEDKKMEGITHAIWALEEIKSRKDTLMFHPDIMTELAALNLIRNDENPFEINEVIHKDKVEYLKREGGANPFIIESGLNVYLPNSKELIKGLQDTWEAHKKIVEKSNMTYDSILGEIKSSRS